jgi:hypothetical protein
MDQRSVEEPGQLLRNAESTGIPGDVALALRGFEPKRAVTGREMVRGVFADEEDGGPAPAVADARDRARNLRPRFRIGSPSTRTRHAVLRWPRSGTARTAL